MEALAVALGLDKSAIAHWEAERCNPRADQLPELAKELGVSIDDLYTEAG
jgi:transcriptional regulator with XRE-family HTH domain